MNVILRPRGGLRRPMRDAPPPHFAAFAPFKPQSGLTETHENRARPAWLATLAPSPVKDFFNTILLESVCVHKFDAAAVNAYSCGDGSTSSQLAQGAAKERL